MENHQFQRVMTPTEYFHYVGLQYTNSTIWIITKVWNMPKSSSILYKGYRRKWNTNSVGKNKKIDFKKIKGPPTIFSISTTKIQTKTCHFTDSSLWNPKFSLPYKFDPDAGVACVVRLGKLRVHKAFQPLQVHSTASQCA